MTAITPILLDQYGREIRREPSAELRARFDLAQTTAHNRKHWSMADSLSAKAAHNPAIRSIVRKRSRYEAENNSWYSGMLRTASNHIVGNGPRLQVLTDNAEANTRLERVWNRWCRAVMFAEKLRLLVETYWRDGEVLAMRTARPRNWPISLDIRTYESEQCSSPWLGASLGDPYLDDGIRVDPNTNEVEYFFYDHHPGDTSFAPTLAGDWYPANEVIHLFRRERPGQIRGIPRCTSSLNTLPVMRRQEMATLLASETAASFATYLKSTGMSLGSQSPADFAEIEIAFNMLTTLPEGWDIAQVDPKHPGPNYNQFQMQALMSFSRCTNMPLALAAGTAKDSTFSSYNGDIKSVWQPEVRTEQNRIELCVVEQIFGWFLEDAVYVPGLLTGMPSINEIDHQWFWQPLPNLDEVEAATAAQLRISTGQSTLSKEHANAGTDYDTEVGTMAKDFGVDVPTIKRALFIVHMKIPPTGMPPVTAVSTAATGVAPAEPTGEYTTLGQRDWNNNQKRIRQVLDQYIAGDISQGIARITLQQIGLTPETIQGYLDDAMSGFIDAPELQPFGVMP